MIMYVLEVTRRRLNSEANPTKHVKKDFSVDVSAQTIKCAFVGMV